MPSKNLTPKFFHEIFAEFFPVDKKNRTFLNYSDLPRTKKMIKTNHKDILTMVCIGLCALDYFKKEKLKELCHNDKALIYISNLMKSSKNRYAWMFDSEQTENIHDVLDALQAYTIGLLDISIYPKKNYILSKNLSKILLESPTPDKTNSLLMDLLEINSVHCFRYNLLETHFFKDITVYIFRDKEIFSFTFIAKIIDTSHWFTGVAYASPVTFKDQEKLSLTYKPFLPYTERKFLYDDNEDLFSTELINILSMTVNAFFYVKNPSRDSVVNEKIAEFAGKRGKINYQKEHFSSEKYTELDLNCEKVRAYEQGKSWFRKAHTRWQPCGKGREELKLVFLSPQFPTRKKLF